MTFDQIMALFAEGRKETAELRESMAKGNAELRASMAERDARADERFAQMEARMEAGNASLHTEVSSLKEIVERNNARLDEATARLDEATAKLDANNAKLDKNSYDVGQLINKLGGIIESVVVPDIVGKFNEKGFLCANST